MHQKQQPLELDLRGITNRDTSTTNSMIGNHKNTQTSRTQRFIPLQFRDKRLTQQQKNQILLAKQQKYNLSFINTPHKKYFQMKQKLRRESKLPTQTERVPLTTYRKEKSFYQTTVNLKNQIPKLRQTGSTQCQSPKANNIQSTTKLSDFKRIRLLGKGKFGDVYLVIHKKTGFISALKIIRKDDLLCGTTEDNQKAINQLIRQIKIQAYLNHPNLIQLYDYFSDNTSIYLLLELACDGHLFDALERGRALTEETTSILVREIVEGIDYMHTRHIIHRDIKLQNIVLTHGMAKICDFGWSVYCPKQFRTTLCGTPLYLSPQILSGRQYNKKIDTWAVGLLTHQLFTGENPFNIQNKNDLNKIITQDFQMEKGSPQMRSFITFILRKNPSKRPDSDTIKRHPFLQKFKGLQTSQQLCRLVYPSHYLVN